MRWQIKKTTRVKIGFLWFPKTINGETRWLEDATWEQQFHVPFNIWINVRWI